MPNQTAVFGGGCFWCLEAVFQRLEGVQLVESGYMGGKRPNPTYQQVCSGATGHVEVVRVAYDPAVISYADLLDVFFSTHDSTTLDRQGNDVGTQYRSVIFYENDEQKRAAEKKIEELTKAKEFNDPIVTAIEPAQTFYKAEGYHQNYYNDNPNQPYCAFIISPKVKKLEKKFTAKLRA